MNILLFSNGERICRYSSLKEESSVPDNTDNAEKEGKIQAKKHTREKEERKKEIYINVLRERERGMDAGNNKN